MNANGRLNRFFLSGLSGILLTAGFPNVRLWWITWFALVFLLLAIRDANGRSSFYAGLTAGLVHFLSLLYWLAPTMRFYGYLPWALSIVILFLLAFYLALYIGFFAVLVNRLGDSPVTLLIAAPTAWVAMEYLRTWLFSGFPWGLLGYSQYHWLTLVQTADIWGVYGISCILVFANTVVFAGYLFAARKTWRGKRITGKLFGVSAALAVFLVGSCLLYGQFRMKAIDAQASGADHINAAVLQGNIGQDLKWDMAFRRKTIDTYLSLSEEISRQHPDLIVWPETAAPFYFYYDQYMTDMVLSGIRRIGITSLVGSPSVEVAGKKDIRYFNSAYLISAEGRVIDRYDKVHLVPFGEYVPFQKWLPFINSIVAQVGDFKPGSKGDTLEWERADMGVLICYEIIFPRLAAEAVANHAGLLVNITNDAWFGNTSAPYQHFAMAAFRAIENRRSLVRAANTGISGFIDPCGRIIQSSVLFEKAAMAQRVPVMTETISVYTAYGDVAAWACFIALAVLAVLKRQFRG